MAPNDPVHALIVDDDRSIQRMLADALSAEGFWVTVERDGEWAVKTFAQKRFDVVLLDLLLPAVNGYEAARQIKAMPKGRRTPILMISGVYKSEVHKREAVEKHGAFAFVEKPLRLSLLLRTLREALGDRYPRPAAPPEELTQPDRLADPQAQEEGVYVERTSRSSGSFNSLSGDFARRPFPELLAEIQRWNGTGALMLRREEIKKIVYFRNGGPISVRSNSMSECLGRVMVKERMISEPECEESLRRMKGSGRLQGTVLIEMGCISPHNLSYALNLQLRTKLLELFSWESGEYQFNPKAELPRETVQLDMPTAEIIYEGIRKSFPLARLKKTLAGVDRLYVRRSENPLFAFQDMGLGEEELNLLKAANGSRSVAQLRERQYLPPDDTDRFIYALTCAQMVELHKEPGPETGVAPHAVVYPVEEISGSELVPLDPPPLAPPLSSTPAGPGPRRSTPAITSKANSPAPGPSGDELLPEISYSPSIQLQGDGAIREKLLGKLAEMRMMDYFEVLGIPRDAPPEKVKRAYFQLAREYHPDKHHRSSSVEVRQLAQQVLEVISTAHDTLASPEERAHYLEELHRGVRRETLPDISRLLTAEQHFRKGVDCFKKDKLQEALGHFSSAVKLSGREGEFRAYLGWTTFLCDPGNPQAADAAFTELERAIELNPTLDRSYLFRGYLYKAQGRPDKAERQFEKAIQCNADCTEALHELSMLTFASQLNRPKR